MLFFFLFLICYASFRCRVWDRMRIKRKHHPKIFSCLSLIYESNSINKYPLLTVWNIFVIFFFQILKLKKNRIIYFLPSEIRNYFETRTFSSLLHRNLNIFKPFNKMIYLDLPLHQFKFVKIQSGLIVKNDISKW